jgi:Dimethlysulfonioproprionate lyase
MNNKFRRTFTQMMVMTAVVAAKPPAVSAALLAADSCRSGLVRKTRGLLRSLHDAALDPFLTDWPLVRERRSVIPSSLPVLRWLPEAQAEAPAFSRALVSELCRVARCMAWRQTYTVPDVDAAFLENYGWSEIVGLSGELASTRIACGFLLLGPETHYPRHRHEAQEIYLPLSGTASWQQGDGIWREQPTGTVIHHASEEPHAMRTGKQPLLALYLWRSANLNQKSQLVGS